MLGCSGKDSKNAKAVDKPKTENVKPSKGEVLICGSKNAYAYHSHKCQGLSRCGSTVKKMTLSEAKEKGYKACGFCYK
jgi:hypothetical protein